jgi:hypothetical protein
MLAVTAVLLWLSRKRWQPATRTAVDITRADRSFALRRT